MLFSCIVVCELSFVSTSYTVSEDVGSVSVCVLITDVPSGGLATDLTVEFSYSTSDSTSELLMHTVMYRAITRLTNS